MVGGDDMWWELLDLLIAFSGLQQLEQSALWTMDTLTKRIESFSLFFFCLFFKAFESFV